MLREPAIGFVLFAAVSAVAAACGGTAATGPSTVAASTLTATVADPAGDAVVGAVVRNGVTILPVVPVPPDLVGATITVSGGILTATISFAAGTLSHADTLTCLMLDADENVNTGTRGTQNEVAIGYDFSICGVNPRLSTTAQVSRLGTGTGMLVSIGTAAVTFPSADQLRFTVPLSMLDNDDGRMAFKVNAMQFVDDATVFNTGPIDWMPDIGRPAGLIR